MKKMIVVLAVSSIGCYAATIDEIIIRSATSQFLSADLVRANMTLQKGSEFSSESLSEDIKTLYGTKQFDDIEAKVESIGRDLVKIILRIKPKPRIDELVINGNSLITTGKIQQQVSQKEGELFDEKTLSEDLRSLNEMYRNKGYYETAIKQQVVPLEGTQNLRIVYEIDERSRYKVRDVEIIGNIAFKDRQLKKLMETEVSFWGYLLPVGFFNETELKSDLDKITQAYLNRGYLDFKIEKVDRSFNVNGSKIYLNIYVHEGRQYHVQDVSVSGNQALETDELINLISLKTDQIYNREQEHKDSLNITNQYSHKGYLDCQVYADRTVDTERNRISLRYIINEGIASTVRDINISGNRVTKDHVIRRELKIHPDDLIDSTRIAASKASLANLGYFDKVEILPVTTEAPDEKDVNVTVVEKLTGQLLFGAGFSSTDNVLGTIEIGQSNFDVKNYPSFRGGGQRFRFRAQAGSSRTDFVLSFTEPWLMHKPLRMDLEAWKRSTDSNREYDQDSDGFSSTFTRKLRRPFWRQSIGYRIENIDINDIDSTFSAAFITKEEGSDLVSALSFGLVRDHRDRILLTSSGSRVSFRSELQTEVLGSYTNQYKITLSGDKYYPVFKKTVVKFSGEIAQVDKINGDLPRIFDRFFAGGANTIRGFKERHVGPIDPGNGEPVGGQSMLLASIEISAPVLKKTVFWSLFVDSGSVWEKSFEWSLSQLNAGAGVGLRLFLPIGAIRLDYGWPVVRELPHLGTGGRFHFNLGYNF
jgi:outer membrane protein insertion porin family